MGYDITDYTIKRAKKFGLTVKPSTRKGKKIDVYKDGKKIASIGALGYGDYPTFLKQEGKAVADEHRRKYRLRHTKNTLGELLALNILW